MKKEKVIFDSSGMTGNIFYILGMVQQVLRKQKRIADFNECRDRVQNSKSYDAALAVIREYVNLIDSRGEK